MKTILFDCETTGLTEPQIIEWAYVEVDFPFKEMNDEYGIQQGRCKPSKPIEFGALATHHILESDLENEPPSSGMRLPPDIGYVVGWNIGSDLDALDGSRTGN
jgi:exodeoxyribonuclease X